MKTEGRSCLTERWADWAEARKKLIRVLIQVRSVNVGGKSITSGRKQEVDGPFAQLLVSAHARPGHAHEHIESFVSGRFSREAVFDYDAPLGIQTHGERSRSLAGLMTRRLGMMSLRDVFTKIAHALPPVEAVATNN